MDSKSQIKYFRIANTTERTSDVSNYYAEPITIGANSKIALESMSIMIDQSQITFDSLNDNFQVVNTDGGESKLATIPNGSYTTQQFTRQLTKTLNSTTELQDNDIRTEWYPIFDQDGKLIIQYLTCIDDVGEQYDFVVGPNMEEQTSGVRVVYNSTDDQGGYVYTQAKFINAAGKMVFPLSSNDLYINKFVCGFINNIPTENVETLGPEDFYFCVYANKESVETNFLALWFNGAPIAPVAPILIESLTQDPVYFTFEIELGLLKVKVNDILFGQVAYSFDQNLHGCFSQLAKELPTVLIWDTTDSSILSSYTASPYQNITSSGISLIDKNTDKINFSTYIGYNNVGAPAIVPTFHSLTFTDEVRLLLGYSNLFYSLDAIGGSWKAENPFNTFIYNNDLLVELPSFMLHSYDGVTTRRRNVIKMVPAVESALENGRRRYVSNFPMFISLTSKAEQILNSMQFRILDATSGKSLPILGSGTCSITLIVQSDN